jgi:hypothetical protein
MERTGERTVTLPWGKARIEDEVLVAGSATEDRTIELGIARLREKAEDGGELLRFFYRSEGRVMRGPLTLREDELDELAKSLRSAPEVLRLVRRLAGVK